ncbi:MAG: hypothetical protein II374_01915 [Lachnospiraceae bacterium]|nr:hypothetical protein [Lachnospiraceae bacterium]
MKTIRKIVAMVMLLSLCAVTVNSAIASADAYQDYFEYKEGDKVYTIDSIVKGKKHLTKYTNKKDGATQYQIVKFSDGKVTLRPQKGWHASDDPYFMNKKFTYKISPKCKFYYTNVCFPFSEKYGVKYKRVTRKNVLEYMNDEYMEPCYCEIEGVKGKYYTGSYFGEMYVKNGEIVAVLTNGGD